MKTLIALAALLILCGCNQSPSVPAKESAYEAKHRLMEEAESKMLQELTNTVTGFKFLVSHYVSSTNANPSEWTGNATAEFVNTVGGVERTNLPFIFSQITFEGTNHMICLLDRKKLFEESLNRASK
ncbi:MAG: hypothetical protein JWR69_926 [Pedosphaera sp.]|nr:hypothetical protein [Pedosphaera sp.]